VTEFALESYLEQERDVIEQVLSDRLWEAVARLDPDRGANLQAMEAGVVSGGKRIRPILCVTAYRATVGIEEFSPPPRAVYELAVSLEMIHAYSLMHDDLPCMDDADLRRGKATPHTRFGIEATLRAGAALIPAAAWSAWEAGARLGGDGVGRNVARILLDAAGAAGMVGGQAVDLVSEGLRLEERALTELHSMKTGALLRASLEMGAIAAGASGATLDGLRSYGSALGLAFQIADDILDRTGTPESLGKNPSDEAFDKSTYVSLLGVDGARVRGAQEVERAKSALHGADVRSAALDALADYILSRAR